MDVGATDAARFNLLQLAVASNLELVGFLPLIRISCAFGSGTGIVTSEKSLILLYRTAFISDGMTNLVAVPLVFPFVAGILNILCRYWR
jgi:hypothetical protein